MQTLIILTSLVVLVTFLSGTSVLGRIFQLDICDIVVEEFYETYARVMRKRHGSVTASMISTGFLDLRNYTGLLCLNGPAVIYHSLTIDEDSVLTYAGGEFRVYVHECTLLNRQGKDTYKEGPPPMTNSTVVYGDKIFGVLIVGREGNYQKAEMNWFQHPQFGARESLKVNGSSFAFINNNGINLNDPCGESLKSSAKESAISSGNSTEVSLKREPDPNDPKAWCVHIAPLKINVTFIPPPPDPNLLSDEFGHICTLEEGVMDPEKGNLFDLGIPPSEYIWYPCPPGDYDKTTTPVKPVTDPQIDAEFIDFRIIGPHHWTSHGTKGIPPAPGLPGYPAPIIGEELPFYSRPNQPWYYFPNEAGYVGPNLKRSSKAKKISADDNERMKSRYEHVKHNQTDEVGGGGGGGSGGGSEGGDEDNGRMIMQPVKNCQGFSRPHAGCEPPDKEVACKLIKKVLTIDPGNWTTHSDPLIRVNVWRQDLMGLIDSIFSRICPSVSRNMPSAISRIMEYYLEMQVQMPDSKTAVKFKEPKNDAWPTLIADLVKCKETAAPMEMRRVRDEEALADIARLEDIYKRGEGLTAEDSLNLKSLLSRRGIRFPYNIVTIPKGRKELEAEPLFYYVEGAELDYELNYAIDAHWKIFATVLGYCNLAYTVRMPSSFMRIYSVYSDDVFNLIADDWINPKDNRILEMLIGEVVNGAGGYWLDSCMEASYVYANVSTYRPLRPIRLTLGESSETGEGDSPVNFFTESPYYKNPPFLQPSYLSSLIPQENEVSEQDQQGLNLKDDASEDNGDKPKETNDKGREMDKENDIDNDDDDSMNSIDTDMDTIHADVTLNERVIRSPYVDEAEYDDDDFSLQLPLAGAA